jgi:hypothetical protein
MESGGSTGLQRDSLWRCRIRVLSTREDRFCREPLASHCSGPPGEKGLGACRNGIVGADCERLAGSHHPEQRAGAIPEEQPLISGLQSFAPPTVAGAGATGLARCAPTPRSPSSELVVGIAKITARPSRSTTSWTCTHRQAALPARLVRLRRPDRPRVGVSPYGGGPEPRRRCAWPRTWPCRPSPPAPRRRGRDRTTTPPRYWPGTTGAWT